jgi:elongator complex protein 1
LNDNEVYILIHLDPSQYRIERTTLETRKTSVAYEAAKGEHIRIIFPSLGHECLWFSKSSRGGGLISYSNGISVPGNHFEISSWDASPSLDTFWAAAIRIAIERVYIRTYLSHPMT